MNILPQFAKDLLKKRLFDKISSISSSLVDSIIDNLQSFDNIKYINTISSIQETSLDIIKNVIIDTFEEIDSQYKYSSYRKSKYNINKSNVKRTLITIVGEISFSRTYYISKLDNSYHFFIDELFNLPSYDHYDPIIKSLAIDKTFSSNQYQAGKDVGESIVPFKYLLGNRNVLHIPRQSIHNWIKNWNEPNYVYNNAHTPDSLFVMADEKFIGSQDLDNDIMAKSMISFEDVRKVCKNRNQLVNRTIYTTVSSKPWEEFVDILSQKYDFSKIHNIYLLGDGASWIKSGINELKMESNNHVTFHLCEFHFKQAINHITTHKDKRKLLLDVFDNKSKNEFKNEVQKIIDDDPNRKDTITKKLDYILNNYSAIKRMKESNIGSSMESHISHYVANSFASRPKGYSSLNIKKYLKLNDYKNNGLNLIQLYLKTYQDKESQTLNEQQINYSIFEKKGSVLPLVDYGIINRATYGARQLLNSR